MEKQIEGRIPGCLNMAVFGYHLLEDTGKENNQGKQQYVEEKHNSSTSATCSLAVGDI
jgi:hypothetical protein